MREEDFLAGSSCVLSMMVVSFAILVPQHTESLLRTPAY